MKKTIALFIILSALLLGSCGNSSTASSIMVTEKGQSDNKYWIKVYNSNIPDDKEEFTIFIKEEMVWNLVEEDRDYFAMYSTDEGKPHVLQNIQQ
ncbi:hypothetical protein NCCP2716_26350 [Sporosarcina sp. NCCP-2716]|uniref:hypothetical protein n=1 Tax=Sporosarcina sp. NCCP-2716 TaxID=2943679 RepID=UPI0020414F90|nr:hypothetical protein [Sporosarcina sp. NCCP-2716]GKV70137.1 hypothetical protein NCCP2716_26350 [Sporosarcina sp. NCCP-2716]